MTLPSLDEIRPRTAHMDAARRMGTQGGLPEPSAAVRASALEVVQAAQGQPCRDLAP